MQLKNDLRKDAHRRAAELLGMRVEDFEARRKLLRAQFLEWQRGVNSQPCDRCRCGDGHLCPGMKGE